MPWKDRATGRTRTCPDGAGQALGRCPALSGDVRGAHISESKPMILGVGRASARRWLPGPCATRAATLIQVPLRRGEQSCLATFAGVQ